MKETKEIEEKIVKLKNKLSKVQNNVEKWQTEADQLKNQITELENKKAAIKMNDIAQVLETRGISVDEILEAVKQGDLTKVQNKIGSDNTNGA
ncbi:hypothetical protein [Clostridium arbusti]|uniref:hypothetical protein n=1 Tax=Clostridium arbusti TaxID=1137848 RepID=UPI00028A3BC1|nr:hypothetical protein [Clostridium arbusti]